MNIKEKINEQLDRFYGKLSEKKIMLFLGIIIISLFLVTAMEGVNHENLKKWTLYKFGDFCNNKNYTFEGLDANGSNYAIFCMNHSDYKMYKYSLQPQSNFNFQSNIEIPKEIIREVEIIKEVKAECKPCEKGINQSEYSRILRQLIRCEEAKFSNLTAVEYNDQIDQCNYKLNATREMLQDIDTMMQYRGNIWQKKD